MYEGKERKLDRKVDEAAFCVGGSLILELLTLLIVNKFYSVSSSVQYSLEVNYFYLLISIGLKVKITFR